MAYVTKFSNPGTTNGSVTVSGIVAGQDLIYAISADAGAGNGVSSWPTGFTQIFQDSDTYDGQVLSIAHKKADGTEGVLAFTYSTTTTYYGEVSVYSGLDATSPVAVVGTVAKSSTGNSSPVAKTANSISPAAGSNYDLLHFSVTDNGTSGAYVSSSTPSGWNARADLSNGGFTNLSHFDKLAVAGGATGTVTSNATLSSGQAGWVAVMIALKNAASGGTSIAVTGVSSASAVASLTPSVSALPSGVTATGAAGSLVADPAASIAGVQASGSAGTLTPQAGAVLTGVSATAGAGSLSITASASPALAGVSTTGTAGSLTPSVSALVAGVQATASAGALTPSDSVALTGVAAAGQSGSLIVQAGASVSGVSATGHAGGTTAQIIAFPSGAQATGQAGSVSAGGNLNIAVSGVAAIGSAGSVIADPGITAVAVSATGHVEAIVGNVLPFLAGVSATGQAGSVTTSGSSVALISNIKFYEFAPVRIRMADEYRHRHEFAIVRIRMATESRHRHEFAPVRRRTSKR